MTWLQLVQAEPRPGPCWLAAPHLSLPGRSGAMLPAVSASVMSSAGRLNAASSTVPLRWRSFLRHKNDSRLSVQRHSHRH